MNIDNLTKTIKDEIKVVKERDPAARSTFEILLTYSGLHAVLVYRLSHKLYQKSFTLLQEFFLSLQSF